MFFSDVFLYMSLVTKKHELRIGSPGQVGDQGQVAGVVAVLADAPRVGPWRAGDEVVGVERFQGLRGVCSPSE